MKNENEKTNPVLDKKEPSLGPRAESSKADIAAGIKKGPTFNKAQNDQLKQLENEK